MKNKCSSRLIAWLLAMVMLLSVSPLSALAEYDATVSNTYEGPTVQRPLPGGTAVDPDSFPDDGASYENTDFTVLYVVPGEYLSDGQSLLLTQYTRTVTNQQPGSFQEKPDDYQVVGRKWNSSEKELVLLLKPDSGGSYTLHYVIIYNKKDGSGYGMVTMNNLRPAWTDDIDSDEDVAMLFIPAVIDRDNRDVAYYDDTTTQKKPLTKVESARVPSEYIHFSKTIEYQGHRYGLTYLGNDYLISGTKGENAGIESINTSDVINWTFHNPQNQKQITLYYILNADGEDKPVSNITPAPTAVLTPTPEPTETTAEETETPAPAGDGKVTLTVKRVLNPRATAETYSNQTGRGLMGYNFYKKDHAWNNAPWVSDNSHVISYNMDLRDDTGLTYEVEANQNYGFNYSLDRFDLDLNHIVAENVTIVTNEEGVLNFTTTSSDATIIFYEAGIEPEETPVPEITPTPVPRYTVTFVDEDGTTVLQEAAEYGYGTAADDIVKPADPEKAPDDRYTYMFAGWDPEIADVTGNATYTAAYTAADRTYEYTVHHYLKGTTVKVRDDETGTAGFGAAIPVTPAAFYETLNLTVDSTDPAQPVTIVNGENVVTVYYTLPLTIAAADAGKTYGETDPGLTAEVTGKLAADEIGCTVIREEGEDAGGYTIRVTDVEAPGYYEVSTTDAAFTISPKAVTVTADNKTKTFGDADPELTAQTEGLPDGDRIEYTLSREAGEDAGHYAVIPEGEADQGNYSVTYVNGDFEITKAGMTVDALDYDGQYDALPHAGGATPSVTEGTTIQYSLDNENWTDDAPIVRNVDDGTVTYYVKATNPNYLDATATGTLVVHPLPITITTGSAAKDYDGKPLENSETHVIGTMAYDERAIVTATGTITDAGSTVNGYRIVWENALATNYDITEDLGELVVNPKGITIRADDKSKGYDKDATTDPELTATVTGAAEGETINYNLSRAAGQNAGEYAITVTAGSNPNYTVTVEGGTFTILPLENVTVTITENGGKVSYDGEEHTVSGYAFAADSALYTEQDFEFSGTASVSGRNAGAYDMELKPEDFANENDNFANVTFVIEDNQLVIDPADVTVTITGHSGRTGYDGTAHTVTGYDTAISSKLYTTDDFTFSGSDSVSGTDAGTYGMELKPEDFRNTNSNFGTVTFVIVEGELVIDPINAVVTIVGANNVADYDGQEHSVNGYTATADTPLYDVDNDIAFSGTAEAARTDAGTADMGLKEEQFANRNPNFETVTFNVTDGYQTIMPIDVTVTITGASNAATYDGQEHNVSGYTAAASTELYDVSSDFTFSGTAEAARVHAGRTNMGLKAEQFANTNDNFGKVTFEVTDGYQAIHPIGEVTVTITGDSDITDYDGSEHSVAGYTVAISNPLYTEADFTFEPAENMIRTADGKVTVSRTDAGTTGMGLAAEQFTNRNDNFAKVIFNVTDGYQTILPIDATVTIVGASNVTAYDGEEHTVTGYTATASTALYDVDSDFTFSGTAEASRTSAGTAKMGLAKEQFENTNSNFGTVTFNVTDGSQTITKINAVVTIVENSDQVDYDGREHTVTGYTATADTSLYNTGATRSGSRDFTFTGTASVSGTDAGTYGMELKPEDFTNNNPNFEKVEFVITKGRLKIDPIDVTVKITEHGDEVDYDGEEHTVTGYDIEISNPLYTEDDFTFSGTASVSGTDAGTYEMELKPEDFTNNDPTNFNVTFIIVDRQLVIQPIEVVVKIVGASNTADYDSTEHKVTGYTATAEPGLYDVDADIVFTGTAEAARTDAGTTEMGLKKEQFANTNGNFSTVTFNVTDGYQTVNPIDVTVTITGNSLTTDYDGKAHSVSGYTATASSPLYKVEEGSRDFAPGNNGIGHYKAERTDAGTTYMHMETAGFQNTNPNFKNVEFVIRNGSVTINPIRTTVTITEHGGEFDYNGTERTVTGYDVEISNPLYRESDFTFTGTASVSGTDAGTYGMELKAEDFTNTNDNFTDVNFVVVDRQMVIHPIDVTVTVTENSGEADYDGKEHTVTGYRTEISNPLYTEDDFTFRGTDRVSGTDAGTYGMELKPEDFTNTNGNFADVTFVIRDGALAVKPIDVTVTITGHHNAAEYDGEAHTVTGYDAEISNELYQEADFTFSGTAEASQTDVGTGTMGLAAAQFANTNGNFATVTFDVTDGYQTITPVDAVAVTITGRRSTVDYDGQAHSVTGYDTEISNPLYTEADFTFEPTENMTLTGDGIVTASRTDAGTTQMGLAEEQFRNTSGNFTNVVFRVTDGGQTIDPIRATVTITGNSGETDYDGEEHSVTGYTAATESELYKVTGEDIDFTFAGTAAVSGTDAGSYDMELKAEDFTNNNPNFAQVDFVIKDGRLVIDPIDVTVTITGATGTDDYDGEEHSVSGYTAATESKLYKVTGENADFTFSGTAAAARTDAGTTAMNLTADQFANTNRNFRTVTFEVEDGWQTIDPIDVTVTITGATGIAEYDGLAHSVEGYTATADTELYDVTKDFIFNGTAAAVQTNAGTANMNLTAGQFVNRNTNFATVTFEVTDGFQTVTKAPVTITAENKSRYDYFSDEYEPKLTAKVEGMKNGESAEEVIGYTLSREKTADGKIITEPGEYAITADGPGETDNYTVTYIPGVMTITAKNDPLYNLGEVYGPGKVSYGWYRMKVTGGLRTARALDDILRGATDTRDYVIADGDWDAPGYDHGPIQVRNTVYQYWGDKKYNPEPTDPELYYTVTAHTKHSFVAVHNKIGGKEGWLPADGSAPNTDGPRDSFHRNFEIRLHDGVSEQPLYNMITTTDLNPGRWYRLAKGTVNLRTAKDYTDNTTFFAGTEMEGLDPYDFTGYQITEDGITYTYKTKEEATSAKTTESYFTTEYLRIVVKDRIGSGVYVRAEDKYDAKDELDYHRDYKATLVKATQGDYVIHHYLLGTEIPVANDTTGTLDIGETVNVTPADVFLEGYEAAQYNSEDRTSFVIGYNGDEHTAVVYYTIPLTVTADDKTVDYGATARELTATITGEVNGDSDEALYTALDVQLSREEGDNVGSYEITAAGTAAYRYYTVAYAAGTYTINPIDVTVTITEHSGELDYDGEEHTITGYDVRIDTDLYTEDDFTFSGEASVSGTDAGTYDMELKPEDFVNTNGNFANVTFVIEDGRLTINPIDVTVRITAHSGEFVYNAGSHSVNGYDVEIENPLYTEDDIYFSGIDSMTARNAGTTPMGLKAADFTNLNPNFAEVTFEVTDGSLVITPKPVTITVNDKAKTYGDDDPGLTATVEGVEGTDSVIPMITREAGEAVGTYAIDAAAAADPNYTFTIVPGTLTIEPKPVMVIAADKAKTFGDTDPVLTAEVTGLADGEGSEQITYTLTREPGEDAGAYTITAAGEAIQGNYTVSYVPAALTIVPEDTVIVRITARNGSFLYDGTVRDLSGYDAEISNPLYTADSFTFSGSSELLAVNAGTYRTEMTPADFTNNDPNFANVVFEVTNGELVIRRRSITLTSADAGKAFDGKALRNNTITVTGDGFAENEGLTYLVTGQITHPGTAENTFEWTANDGTLAENYDITKVTGTLTVTPGDAHALHITYVYEDGTVIGTFGKSYAVGQHFEVRTAPMTGYTPDTEIVAGVMGSEDIEVTVTYRQDLYTLTIRFHSIETGEDVTDPAVMQFHAGEHYSVEIPEVNGYTPKMKVISGTMPATDRTISVMMDVPEEFLEIEDNRTPLGINNANLGSGELIE